MNPWKPVSFVLAGALVLSVGYQAASANTAKPGPTAVAADRRHMEIAVDLLRQARGQLDQSEHNHGGWRDRAIESTDRAIRETIRGIEWTNY